MIIRTKLFRVLVAAMTAAVLLTSCSRDPNVRKQKYMASGNRYYDQGKFREAAIEYSNALQIDARDADAHYALAKAYMKMESYTSAYRELARTVDLRPDNIQAQM